MAEKNSKVARVFAVKLAQHQNYLQRAATRFTRPGLDADDVAQEAAIALWMNLQRKCTRPDHVAEGKVQYADLPDADLDPLLMRSMRTTMLSAIRKEEAGCRDYRMRTHIDDAPEIRDDAGTPEHMLAEQQDVERQRAMMDELIELAFSELSDDACVVAYELLHPRRPEEVPGWRPGRRIDPRSTYSIAAIMGVSRDKARSLILEVRAMFAWAGAQVGLERDLSPLVRA